MTTASTLAAVLAGVFALLSSAFGDTLYLKVEGIKGDIPDLDHKDWSIASSFRHSVGRPIAMGRTAGTPQFSNLTVTKSLDAASPFLFAEATGGKAKDVEIELVRTSPTRERYYRIKLYDALISGYSTTSSGDKPTESISFDFVRIDLTYTDYTKLPRSTTAWYDLVNNIGGIQNSNPPNTAPLISAIPNTATAEDTPLSVNFTIGDAQTAAGSLTLSAESSNPSLATITFGGAGSNRMAQIQPSLNQHGSATITIRVSDGTLSATSVFSLIVNPQNDTPTIAPIDSQTTPQDTPVMVNVTLSDVDTPAGNLVLTGSSDNQALVPGANIAFGGTAADRTVTIQPAPGAFGQAKISVTVSDGSLTASQSFLLVVNQAGAVDISLSNDHVPEQSPAGTVIGSLSATVAGATFSLADSAGGRFRIQGNQLQVNGALDHEDSATHSILVSARASGSGEFTKAFAIFVDDVNEAPMVLLLDTSTIEAIGGRFTPITRLQIADPETNSLSLTLEAVNGIIRAGPSVDVTVGSNNTARVLLAGTRMALNSLLSSSNGISYRANTGISGTDLLTATVSDSPHTATATLAIRIYRSQYDQWLHTQFPEEYLNDPAMEAYVWGHHVDLDGDRLETVAEYALGTDIFTYDPISASVGSELSLAFKRRQDPDLQLEVQIASELESGSWSSDPSVLEAFPPIDIGNGFEQLRFADRQPVTAGAKRFIRLRWTLNP